MRQNQVEFLGSFPNRKSVPVTPLPSIAFIGRSNVGKSSFINHLLNRKGIAKTSSVPGKTQLLNFFKVNQKYHFVDLPGYGFAKVPIRIKVEWTEMMTDFLWNYSSIGLIIQLVDIRHKPSKEDKEFNLVFKSSQARLEVIASKADKIKPREIRKHLQLIQSELSLERLPIKYTITNQNLRSSLWKLIQETFAQHQT